MSRAISSREEVDAWIPQRCHVCDRPLQTYGGVVDVFTKGTRMLGPAEHIGPPPFCSDCKPEEGEPWAVPYVLSAEAATDPGLLYGGFWLPTSEVIRYMRESRGRADERLSLPFIGGMIRGMQREVALLENDSGWKCPDCLEWIADGQPWCVCGTNIKWRGQREAEITDNGRITYISKRRRSRKQEAGAGQQEDTARTDAFFDARHEARAHAADRADGE
jgi:hypothetical protein